MATINYTMHDDRQHLPAAEPGDTLACKFVIKKAGAAKVAAFSESDLKISATITDQAGNIVSGSQVGQPPNITTTCTIYMNGKNVVQVKPGTPYYFNVTLGSYGPGEYILTADLTQPR